MLSKHQSRQIPKRTKQWHSKVRTGCLVCRRRRIKCGEEKPNCKNCQFKQLSCEYAVPTDLSQPNQSAIQYAVTSKKTPTANRALLYFRERTCAAFGNGAAPEGGNVTWLMHSIVQSAAQTSPIVRDLVVALASRQECRDSTAPSDALLIARKHYSSALSNLRTEIYNLSPDTVILCSLLCAANSDIADDETESAVPHLMHGVAVLRQATLDKPGVTLGKTLYAVFAEIAMAGAMFAGPIPGSICRTEMVEPCVVTMPDHFDDLRQSKAVFQKIVLSRFQAAAQLATGPQIDEHSIDKATSECRSLQQAWRDRVIKYRDSCKDNNQRLYASNILFQYDGSIATQHWSRVIPFMQLARVTLLSYSLTAEGRIHAYFASDGPIPLSVDGFKEPREGIHALERPDAAEDNFSIWHTLHVIGKVEEQYIYQACLKG